MDSLHHDDPSPSDDLSALAWVHEELRKSLDSAHKALHRCLKDVTSAGLSDMDAMDPAILRTARQQIHQGVGALELAGVPAGATLLRAAEAVVQKFVNRPQSITDEAVRDVEKASFALLDYVSRRLAGKPVSAMALFPQYEALMARVGSVLPRPTDLWSQDWPDLSLEAPLAPPENVPVREADARTVDDFETGLLNLLKRNQPADAVALADLCASLASGAVQRAAHRESATWMLASGFLEGLAGAHVPLTVHAKRVLSQLLSQLRVLVKGKATPSDRLANELLFFCAQASDVPAAENSVLARVRRTFGLERHKPVDLQASSLGKYDPAWVAQAIKRVAGAKDGWSAVAAGELLRLGGLNEQFSLVSDSLRRLFPDGQVLADALTHAVQATVQASQAPAPALAMEVATSLLYLEASLEDGEFDHPDQQQRVQRLAQRIEAISQGQDAQPLESWMEALYRRVSDRQTIGSVVQELRSTLTDCEKHIDQFFRDSKDVTPLVNVPSQLQSMRGVLAVLGLDVAAHATVRMREAVDHLLVPGADLDQAAQEGVFDRLATNLGALGFLIDMMGVQPALAKSLFTMDEATGVLAPVMGREKKTQADPVEFVAQHVQQEEAHAVAEEVAEVLERDDASLTEVSEQLQKLADTPHVQEQAELAESVAAAQAALESAQASDDESALAAAREQVSQVLSDFTQSVSDAETLQAEPQFPPQAPLSLTPAAAAPEETGLEEDDEMRDIFLEEAREVIDNAQQALVHLASQPDDVGSLTAVRRGFHTLKGSSRMVGLKEYGEAAWACEQMYNAWLASQTPASADLQAVTADVLGHFALWTDAISAKQDRGWSAQPVIDVADALRLRGERRAISDAGSAPAAEAESQPEEPPEPVIEVLAEAALPEPLLVEDAASAPELLAEPRPVFTEPDWELPSLDQPVDEVKVEPLPVVESLSFDDLDLPDLAAPAVEDIPAADIALLDIETPESDTVLDLEALPEVDTQPQDLMAEPVPDHELIVLDLEAPADVAAGIEVETIHAPSTPAALYSEYEQAEEAPLGEVELTDPKEVVILDDDDPTQAADLDVVIPAEPVEPVETVGTVEASSPVDVTEPSAPESEGDNADEPVKVVGPLRISIPLFNIYLNEADEQSRRLSTSLGEWALELHRPVSDEAIALAHSLAGNSGTVGYTELSQLARLLEHALMRSQSLGGGETEAVALFNEAAEEIRRLLHQFAAGFLKTPSDELMRRLEWYDHDASRRIEARSLVSDLDEESGRDDHADPFAQDAETIVLSDSKLGDLPVEESRPHLRLVHSAEEVESTQPAPLGVAEFRELTPLSPDSDPLQSGASTAQALTGAGPVHWDDESDIDAQDNVDPDLFPIFEEEAQELLPQLSSQTRQWLEMPDHPAAAAACMRTLHTFKGGARLAGAMRLGELAHRMESTIERLLASDQITHADIAPLEGRVDRLVEVFEALRANDAQSYDEQVNRELPPAEPVVVVPERVDVATPIIEPMAPLEQLVPADEASTSDAMPAVVSPITARQQTEVKLAPIDWGTLPRAAQGPTARLDREHAHAPSQAVVRVRPQLLDRLVNHAGEVSITRTRLQSQVGQIRGSLTDLTDNLERLRQQLRDIELQAETQLSTRMEAARAQSQNFDPLEFDRYTRFQELTRMMAESVNDVATVQRTLQRNLETAEDQLAAQARLTRDLQDDLLRTRMVEFDGLSDRLYRVVRQAAKETGKQVRLDIVGGSTEIDRGVLERMTGSFEHLLRNCITHGIEDAAARTAAGKDAAGQVIVALRHEGNEVAIEFRDDGAGLNLERIRKRAVAMGLLLPDDTPSEAELSQLIFTSGFSTAESVTELAGRGIGMDVVRSEVNAMGGRIETATTAGKGTSFTLILPLTTAVTKVVMLRCGAINIAVPTHLIEMVRRARPQEVELAYKQGSYGFADLVLPFYWLGSLLDFSPRGMEGGRSLPIVIVRSAQQRIALHVDEVLGNQEVVVKNLGPQLARLPGLAGMTLLASGAVSLIYNPVALATVYGDRAQAQTAQALSAAGADLDGWLQANSKQTAKTVTESTEAQTPLVLVVDDSLTVRKVTQRLLAREGYRVMLAKDGLEALELLAQERPAVILSDIEMPRMDGFDLVRNIRADQKLSDLPVIMITSRIAQKHRDYATELGVNHYLGKPYGEEELLALVGRYAALNEVTA
ncbi:MAG: Hpt domain-containing protein [Aquabacterium sp.]|uniref:hybrid sensor histidine kinase/response regulator n=1 Tax=Aquabacterium sp. TaxID=1872578 RepID=UPI0025C452F9|nr:Hpt domain-containing protein [Aquabacterium sp.]MBI5926899.1 Hpt domain-containing protein [Aquabacterium sp.]